VSIDIKALATARDELRSMYQRWHTSGPHATHDAPTIEKAILALDVLLAEHAKPLEFDDTVAVLCAVAQAHGWRLKSWGLQRLVNGDKETR